MGKKVPVSSRSVTYYALDKSSSVYDIVFSIRKN